MDRLTQLRGEAGSSRDSTLDTSATPSEAYITANESSKYFSLPDDDSNLTEDDSSLDITPIKDVSLTSTAESEKSIADNLSNLSPKSKKSDLLDGYKIGKQIEAANILSGGVEIFDDNDNSYDGDELVIDDNVEADNKASPEVKAAQPEPEPEPSEYQIQKDEDDVMDAENEPPEILLLIDGTNVKAIDIGNGLYLYRKEGEEELAAIQIIDDGLDHPTFKFLKVRENAEGNLEVYEEIPVEVPCVPKEKIKENASLVSNKDKNKVANESVNSKIAGDQKPQQAEPSASTSYNEDTSKTVCVESRPAKMMKFNETRKSPVIHSTPNKEGIPLTKTMVNMHLHPNRPLDKVKTIEVHTDSTKQKITEIQGKIRDEDNKPKISAANINSEKPIEKAGPIGQTKETLKLIEQAIDGTIINDKHLKLNIKIDEEVNIITGNTKSSEKSAVNDETNRDIIVKNTESNETSTERKIEPSNTSKESIAIIQKTDDNRLSDTKNATEKQSITQQQESTIRSVDCLQGKQSLNNISLDKPVTSVNKEDKPDSSISLNEEVNTSAFKEMISLCGEGCAKLTDTSKTAIDKSDKPEIHDTTSLSETSKNDPAHKRTSPNSQSNIEKSGDEHNYTSDDNVSHDQDNKLSGSKDNNYGKLSNSNHDKISKNISDSSKDENLENIQTNTESKTTDKIIADKDNMQKPSDKLSKNTYAVHTINEKSSITGNDILSKEVSPAILSKDRNEPYKTLNEHEDSSLINEKADVPLLQPNVIMIKNTSVSLDALNSAEKPVGKANKRYEHVAVKTVPQKPAKEDPKQLNSNQSKIKIDSFKSQHMYMIGSKSDLKTNTVMPPVVPMVSQGTTNKNFEKTTSIIKKEQTNNNHAAVPFGQWTSAHRQEFLSKIKETKHPSSTSNTKSISKPNDLNRRDVLQKIDSQRQTNSASSKNQEFAKQNIKNEAFTNKPVSNNPNIINRESKITMKAEAITLKPVLSKKVENPDSGFTSHRSQTNSTVTSSSYMAKSEGNNRNEFNNQDLIDKTVEGIINRVVSTKVQDSKPILPKEPRTQVSTCKSVETKPTFDAIEMKMNELHGIPFVERPPHELPKVYNRDIKTYAKADNTKPINKASKIPNLSTVTKTQQKEVKNTIIDLDSEEEVIEHEPITGDIYLPDKNRSKQSNTSVETNMAQVGSDSSKKGSIITEKDFDKFVRRNSFNYENCLTVSIEKNKNRNAVQGLVQKDIADRTTKNEPEAKPTSTIQNTVFSNNNQSNNMQITSKLVPVSDEALNQNYPSKLQLAYQTALTTKRQMESPITILEDKPVKVVFMDSNTDFLTAQLKNVQGPELSPSKKAQIPKEPDSVTTSTCDYLDSEVLHTISKPQEETKTNKTKHQRKQVLTPVETPELELVVPEDLGITEVSPKKKRRTDDLKVDKSPKVPKKSYLLGRNNNPSVKEKSPSENLLKDASKHVTETNNVVVPHKDTASAIDNLVKAAELIENQSGTFKENTDMPTTDTASSTPAKRGRGRPRKYPLPDNAAENTKAPNIPQKKPRLITTKHKTRISLTDEDNSDDSSRERIIRENWTMGKINENIVCPICSKLFRTEDVLFKHVKHCTGPSPNRSDSDNRSRRRSRISQDSKSMDSKFDGTDNESDKIVSAKNLPKKRKSRETSYDSKDDVIVIEDTPVKSKSDKSIELKQQDRNKITKTKAQYKVSNLSCEHCGKTFRQLSYLVSHKLLHKKTNPNTTETDAKSENKSVFSCQICKKEFRQLHHLAQHRIIHNPINARLLRKTSSEISTEDEGLKEKNNKQTEDQSAAFRCEPCDKSFRKLHHLVEHRETHDGINRQKSTPLIQTVEKATPNPPQSPQCDICKKKFRKLHHLVEHKEQHAETSSEKSDDKSVKSALSAKDIIHECSLCYMVFPNEHSLNKHSVFCQRKKRQTFNKQSKQEKVSEIAESRDTPAEKTKTDVDASTTKTDEVIDVEVTETPGHNNELTVVEKVNDVLEPYIKEQPKDMEEKHKELPVASNKNDTEKHVTSEEQISETAPEAEVPLKIGKVKEKEDKLVHVNETHKKKIPVKTTVSTANRRKSNHSLAIIKENKTTESSDDEDVRYMLNPDYKFGVDDSTSENKLFMKVKAKKRNSLQFDRPNSKDLVNRRTSLQHPPKVPRLKSREAENSKPVIEPVPLTDSDDSDVKYSFPEKVQKMTEHDNLPKEKRKSLVDKAEESEKTPKRKRKPITGNFMQSESTPKENKRKPISEKRKMLSGIARKKSLGKPALVKPKQKVSLVKEVKRRRGEVEHRCDCGQLFSSAALLARHTSLAHTPPRVRRRRLSSPPPATRKSNDKAPIKKAAPRADTENATPKAKPGRPPGKTPTRTPPSRKSRNSELTNPSSHQSSRKLVAHRGVPVPEKMKKLMDKLKK